MGSSKWGISLTREGTPNISAYQTIYKAPDDTMEGIRELVDLLPESRFKEYCQGL
ncbi:hypothetical protein J4464_01105 [Candidatus Woesearchaeota archaeon]|nr:hypothetical protein [Candidatus Woesearchaeota archaeon]